MGDSTTPQHFNWESVYNVIQPQLEDKVVARVVNELDNDPRTLEKETVRFECMLSTVSPRIKVAHLEKDKETGSDLFVLTVESMDFEHGIRNLFKDLGFQYDVGVGAYAVPIKDRANSSSMRPIQNTVFVSRIPLKNLKRSLTFTLLGCALSFIGLYYIISTFYRVVLV